MRDSLIQLARRIQERPWNRPGTDKTWVVQAMWQQRRFAQEVRRATRACSLSPASRSLPD